MSFASPSWLLALAVVPAALAAHAVARRRTKRYAVRFTAVTSLRLAAGTAGPDWRRHLPTALALAALATLALALARPRTAYSASVDQATVMLVTDHSGSMDATDVQPTRLVAAERAANTFIDKLPSKALLGAIAFSSSPDAVQAPAPDHGAARSIINSQAADGSTDTGDALELALQLLHAASAKHPPAAIVLLSDGAANAGTNPIAAAQQAAHAKIPIYTVALGTPNGTLANPDPFGAPVPVPPDPALMQQIARTSGGRAFNAQSAGQLSLIYQRLGSRLGSVQRKRDITAAFAAGGLVLIVLAAVVAARWSGRLP
jgi:Ca-activated chloride channel family protein